jgi:NitT/TauT family transport system permease protein
MSMAGGWFFLMINEAFVLGDKDFRLPGLGSYMSVASARGDVRAMVAAMGAMVVMIVGLDQLLWRPLVAWAQKFRVEEGTGEVAASSWLLDVLRHSGILATANAARNRVVEALPGLRKGQRREWEVPAWVPGVLSIALFGALLLGLLFGAVRLVGLLRSVPPGAWLGSIEAGLLTLGRVLLATASGTLWALPAGLAIGLSPRLSRIFQPVVQVAASFPAPMLFPAVIAVLRAAGVTLGWGSVVLMLLGTQWYILFNVIAGASSIPGDLREVAKSYRLGLLARTRALYLPAVFPYLVTGWVTATGGAWNASIVSEYVSFKGQVLTTDGLGARISEAAEHGDFPLLAGSVAIMSVLVVLFNRTVWHACYRVAERRFSLSK